MQLLENCSTIVASSLEQSNWLRKTRHVRLTSSDSHSTSPIGTDTNHQDTSSVTSRIHFQIVRIELICPHLDVSSSNNVSLMALSILAEHATILIDIVYNITDEKDRVVLPFVQTLVTHIMPYVRAHTPSNACAYRSVSNILMNMSHYVYTRKAWKKYAWEQLFDVNFFHVDHCSLRSWKTIVGNMMINDKSLSLHDIMIRIHTVSTGLFASKDNEYEQRAMLMKRLAFVVYSLDKDQSSRYLPEILERLTDLLKLPFTSILHVQILHFFRVLLVRISNRHIASFWPILITELLEIFLQLEQDLRHETNDRDM
jgi:hypothetical protein